MSINQKEFLDLPNELINKILLYCSIRDLCRLSKTSRKLREIAKSDYLWSCKWLELINKCGLSFPKKELQLTSSNDNKVTDNYSRCKRLWCIYYAYGVKAHTFPICNQCKQKTCTDECLERWERKIAIDIGSKITWLITPSFVLHRHPSVIISSFLRKYPNRHNFCHNICLCERNCISYQKSLQICLICNNKYGNIIEDLENSKTLYCNYAIPSASNSNIEYPLSLVCSKNINVENNSSATFHSSKFISDFSLWTDLHNIFQKKFPNCDAINIMDSIVGNENFYVLEHYLYHLLDYFQLLDDVQKPNMSFVLCIPFNMKVNVQKNLLKFAFEVLKASRLCFVNKALCISSLIGTETCLVVDSGALNTVVSLIINNEVQFERIQYCQVGGVSIANYLAHSIKMKTMKNVTITSLDASRVKSSCFLSYNFNAEEKRKVTTKRNIFVRCNSVPGSYEKSELQKLELSSELYLAPEIMYSDMMLPSMICKAINGLDESLIKEALSHLLLTGSNTQLNGFATRLIRDLQILMPQYAHVINFQAYAGNRSFDVVMGATHLLLPTANLYNVKSSTKLSSSLFLMTRDEYILHGHSVFE